MGLSSRTALLISVTLLLLRNYKFLFIIAMKLGKELPRAYVNQAVGGRRVLPPFRLCRARWTGLVLFANKNQAQQWTHACAIAINAERVGNSKAV